MPHPTAAPAAFARIAASARSQNEMRMPKLVARAPAITAARPCPALLTSPNTLRETIGRTQGIAFNINPPNHPSSKMTPSPVAAGGTASKVVEAVGVLTAEAGRAAAMETPGAGSGSVRFVEIAATGTTDLTVMSREERAVTGAKHERSLQAW